MKKVALILTVSVGTILAVGCSKKDCVCNTTYTIDGVVQSSSSSSGSGVSSPAPVNSAGDESTCNNGDSFSSYTNSQGQIEESRTECELE